MNTDFSSARIFTNLQGLSDLKLAAKNEETASIEEAAKQFESLFVHMMLKTMRDASQGSELFGSDQMQFHQDMLDQQLALELGEKKSLGIADMLMRQLGHQPKNDMNTPFNQMIVSKPPVQSAEKASVPEAEPDTFDTPQEFIDFMRPLAEKAAARLGVNVEVLIAQSALETGWGKKIIRDVDGTSSHNLFGIKANSQWQGDSTRVNTLEFIDGAMQKTRDTFRVYNSFAESFDDYANFLMSNPRYENAVNNVSDSEGFISALQQAGYATDPRYADKIIDIMQRDTI